MKANRLASESSPYLLQHAHNPVDWHPWSDEAFAQAQARNVPVFLSIGYSTCHWCHVMERESFEDAEVAKRLNSFFVSIKVDREERPDIDGVYMTACQMLTGSGGWPLNLFLLPDKRPFFAATYIPRESVLGRMGMLDLTQRVHQIWNDDRERALEAADRISTHLRRATRPVRSSTPLPDTDRLVEHALRDLNEQFDPQFAGFGNAPKFPSSHNLAFLVRAHASGHGHQPLTMAVNTLRAMRRGGVYDQIGFGLHRYSTDRRWLLPHFEKMLYDQALFILAALEAHEQTGSREFADMARDTIEYVLRDLLATDGCFFSAEDADSEGVEGRFYVWRPDEVRRILDGDAELFLEAYEFAEGGNFAHEATGERDGTNIPHRVKSTEELARRHGIAEDEVRQTLEQCRQLLLRERSLRTRPHRDEKVLADQNGLMLAALARAARVLDAPELLTVARSCRDGLWQRFSQPDGRLAHAHRDAGDGSGPVPGMLDDYAAVAWGLLETYHTAGEEKDLQRARLLGRALLEHFLDEQGGGFHFTPHDGEELPARLMDGHDGATPSGNSMALDVLARLGRLTDEQDYTEAARRIPRAFAEGLLKVPHAHCHMLAAMLRMDSTH